jgi:hypothetical protein
MRYQCCRCHKQFEFSQAVDGYKKGYKVGFLCPHCGVNLIERYLSPNDGSISFIQYCIILFGPSIYMRLEIEWRSTVLIIIAIGLALHLVYFVISSNRETDVIHTSLGPGEHCHK